MSDMPVVYVFIAFLVMIILIAAAAVLFRWTPQRVPTQYLRLLQSLVETTPIIYGNAPKGGLYQVLLPGQESLLWHDLIFAIYDKDLALFDPETTQAQRFAFTDLEFVSPPIPTLGGLQLSLHYNVNNKWRIVYLKMQAADMHKFRVHLAPHIPDDLSIPTSATILHGPAQQAEQDIHGVWTFGTELYVYLFPHLLVTLSGSTVHTRIPIRAIDRVLSIERLDTEKKGLLDVLLQGYEPGIIRVHYQGNILTFAHKSYEQFARAIARTADCKYEHISRKAKQAKW